MKENKYDNETFFNKYSNMERSIKGLEGAGEWHELKKLLPEFKNKRVLDLGCGFGWHCQYAAEHGAKSVVGIDISEKMISEANKKTNSPIVKYICQPIEDIEYETDSFDVVISSLAFHYIKSFEDICAKISNLLSKGGNFIFSVEHPIFTAYGTQDWYYNEQGIKLHWPVDKYFEEGIRKAVFLGEDVIKYHKTLTTYINSLVSFGFEIVSVIEPQPETSAIKNNPDMIEEFRRPMMLIISSIKK